MARPASLSGFPEWLPEQRIVEQHVLDTLRRTFELWGISSIETRAVEPLEQLLSKGEVDKEVYVVRRLHADPAEPDDRQLALHFDLTVPLARYVLENAGRLQFPFRRYQIQKAWRGERPQEGRFREFVQADVDVVGLGELPFHHEVELPLVVADALTALRGIGLPAFTIQVNNRKVAEGFYRGLGLDDPVTVLRIVDKLDKIGPEAVARTLQEQAGADERQARACLELAAIRTPDASFVDRVRALSAEHGVDHPVLDTGLEELARVVEAAVEHAPGVLVADLRIARGLDYYTGTVYETVLDGHPDLGSICSGGRYDALVSDGRTTYPGVGLSIGVSRLVSRLLRDGLARPTRAVPACVLVAVPDEKRRAECDRIAGRLRRRGIPVEVSPSAAKFGKQIRHADRRGIPFVWFPAEDGADAPDQIKDIRSGEQTDADADSWQPPVEDLHPRVVAAS
jgi:histidyl-tRNA synthetase